MPGRPITKAFFARLDADGGINELCRLVVEGETMTQIGARYGVSRWLVYDWLKAHPEHKEAFKDARVLSADGDVEDALQVLRDAIPELAHVAKAKGIADLLKWRASVRNREAYGAPEKGLQVNVHVGDLHLDALRQAGGPVRTVETVEVHTLPEGQKELTP